MVVLKATDVATTSFMEGEGCMGGADAVVNRGLKGHFCIRNLVYERFGQSGVANSQLTGWGMKNTGTIDGVWSPDSLYNYTPLNGYCNPNIW